jgi:hypothetical protein
VVIVRRNQVASVLPMLAQAHRIPSVLFLGNSATGPEHLVNALGKDRVLTGMVNAEGERGRDTGVVRYLWRKPCPGLRRTGWEPSARTAAIQDLFTRAGLPAHTISNVEAAQKTHAAGLPGFAGAVYAADGVQQLAHSPRLIRMFVAAYREALRGLRADGTPITPASNRLVEWIPPAAAGVRFAVLPQYPRGGRRRRTPRHGRPGRNEGNRRRNPGDPGPYPHPKPCQQRHERRNRPAARGRHPPIGHSSQQAPGRPPDERDEPVSHLPQAPPAVWGRSGAASVRGLVEAVGAGADRDHGRSPQHRGERQGEGQDQATRCADDWYDGIGARYLS